MVETLIGSALSILSAFLGYLFGRRAKIDAIQIAKLHELAEELSCLLQQDYEDRRSLRDEYDATFGHLSSHEEAMHYFYEYRHLYESTWKMIYMLPKRIEKLERTNQRAAIYLSKPITNIIKEYCVLTKFNFETDGNAGLVDTYAADFFENLMDRRRELSLERLYANAMNRLRKSVK